MERQLTREDILKARGVYLYMNQIIYVELEEDEVYECYAGGSGWTKKENFYDYFESSLMMSYFSPITREEIIEMLEPWPEA